MSHGRAVVRIVVLAGWTLAMYVVYLVTRLSRVSSAQAALRARGWCFRHWATGTARLIGMTVRVDGPVPTPPCFLVSNHLSYIDVVALGMTADWTFVAKSEVARWPVIGFLAAAVNVIFIDRRRRADLPRVIGLMEDVLASGQGVTFFPEGSSSDGSGVLPFRPSLFEAPIKTGYPVACASVSYRTPAGQPPAQLAVCWWGDMTFVDHFYAMMRLPGFESQVTYAESMVTGSDRKELAEAAHRAVLAEFTPVSGATRVDDIEHFHRSVGRA